LINWRTPIIAYPHDPSIKVDKNIRRSVFKFILPNDELYQGIAEDLLLKCLDFDQAKVLLWETFMTSKGYCFVLVAANYFTKDIARPSSIKRSRSDAQAMVNILISSLERYG
jgi:hypothetical protein